MPRGIHFWLKSYVTKNQIQIKKNVLSRLFKFKQKIPYNRLMGDEKSPHQIQVD
jgi:hypothetical protein